MTVIVPKLGEKIRITEKGLVVPDTPIIPYIEGDGIGVDITPVMHETVDAAVRIAYGDTRRIAWMEVYAGEKAAARYDDDWLPQETINMLQDYVVSIKGPLTTPIGKGFRSLNVAIRQQLDLYACVRPVRYFPGISAPVVSPEDIDMTIFRENTEDIYAGIEWQQGSDAVRRVIDFLQNEMAVTGIRFPDTAGIGIKPVSQEGTERLVRKAIQHAIDCDCRSVALVHKGNIMKFTEGAFMQHGYALAQREFGAKPLDGGPWHTMKNPHTGNTIVMSDVIADNFLQQILLRPKDYDVIATLNLNGDYISDALAAQVGGIGIAPGANMADHVAVFEATHGTAPKYAGQNKVNPCSLLLSAEMLLRYIGWQEAATVLIEAIAAAIAQGKMTYDLARNRDDVDVLSTSAFGRSVVACMSTDKQ